MTWSKDLQKEIESLKNDLKKLEDVLENSTDVEESLKKASKKKHNKS